MENIIGNPNKPNSGKKKKNKNSRNKKKRDFNEQINDGIYVFSELEQQKKNFSINEENNQNKSFYKNTKSKSMNNIKVQEIKESIRKNNSYNIIGDIILGIGSEGDNFAKVVNTNKIKRQKSTNSITSNKNQNFEFIDFDEDNEYYYSNNNSNQEKSKKTKKDTIKPKLEDKNNIKYEDIKNLDLRINEPADYNNIQTPFKLMGEELINEEINSKFKPRIKQHPENNTIIRKLRDIFKKLVNKELRDKPNISQILLDTEMTDDVKIKIIRKFIKYTTEDEVFSEEAERIKIEIQNLIKQKKLKSSNDYDELYNSIETKIMPLELKTKLEDMYYRVIGGDQPKLYNFINNVLKLPYNCVPNILDKMVNVTTTLETKKSFITSLYEKLNKDLFGLEETKDSIMSFICQKLNNPGFNSNKYLCLCGPAGVGKTSIVHSISEALNIPYSYISLANIDDAGSLIGHGYTYEGSQYGAIAGAMIRNKCANGIILFDELDKCKEKIHNTLLGIFDPLQNNKFRDAYFGEFNIDLSKNIMILCLNDLEKINPILKDRLHIVNIPGYTIKEKKIIINKFILPKLQNQYNIDKEIDDDIFNKIIDITKEHKGIRQIQMYITKIFELVVLDRFTNKYNFSNKITLQDINNIKLFENVEKNYLNMYN
jgi:hypothetical protein